MSANAKAEYFHIIDTHYLQCDVCESDSSFAEVAANSKTTYGAEDYLVFNEIMQTIKTYHVNKIVLRNDYGQIISIRYPMSAQTSTTEVYNGFLKYLEYKTQQNAPDQIDIDLPNNLSFYDVHLFVYICLSNQCFLCALGGKIVF